MVKQIGTSVQNPSVNVTGDRETLLAVQNADKQLRKALRELMKARAAEMQLTLFNAVSNAYKKGTGRFARGIKVKGSTTEQRGFLEGKIHVSIPNYRESRFLTALGSAWAGPPPSPYFIVARGAAEFIGGRRYHDRFTEARADVAKGVFRWTAALSRDLGGVQGKHNQRLIRDPVTGKQVVSLRTVAKATPKKDIPRLKVPYEGYGTLGERGGVGRGRHAERVGPKIGGVPVDFDKATGFMKGEAFYYPIWVIHPGFPQGDVVADVLQQLHDETINMWRTLVLDYQRNVTERKGRTLRARLPRRLPSSGVVEMQQIARQEQRLAQLTANIRRRG